MNFKSSFEKESNLAIMPDEGTPRYADFCSPVEPTTRKTGQANSSSKGRNRPPTVLHPTAPKLRYVLFRDDPRYVGSNETLLRNEQTTL